MQPQSRHQCFIYDGSPALQLPTLAAMIQQKLDENFRCLYMNTGAMVAGLHTCLSATGTNVALEVAQGRLVLSSDSVCSPDGGFEIDTMLQRLEDAVDQACKDGFKGLWATGDMTWEFGNEKNFAKLIEYEYKLEKLFRKREELSGVCQYHRDTLPADVPKKALHTHPAIFVSETVQRINPHFMSPRFLSDVYGPSEQELNEMIAAVCQLAKS